MTDYLVYDVFTQSTFGGNQLAVIPDASGLAEADLQRIAAEFNYSETTFVYPPEDGDNTAKVRIFTPTMEVPFAGHPLVGTAIALHDLGRPDVQVLELDIGPIEVTIADGKATFVTYEPLEILAQPEPALVAQALGLDVDAIQSKTHDPIMAGVGLDFVIAELKTRDDLAKITVDIGAFRSGKTKYPSGLDFAIFAYVRDGQSVDARMFAPLDNIPEDPATGSACAALTALLRNCDVAMPLSITQGEDMGRPSQILADLDGDGGISIAGHAVCTMKGALCL